MIIVRYKFYEKQSKEKLKQWIENCYHSVNGNVGVEKYYGNNKNAARASLKSL